MSDDETVSENGERDNDTDDSAFNDIRSQISDMETEEGGTPVAETTHNIGGQRL